MGNPPLSRALAREAVRFVERALKEGYPLKAGAGRSSAIIEAWNLYVAENSDRPDGKISETSFRNRLAAAERLYGLKPRIPKNPKKLPARENVVAFPQLGGTPLHARIVQLQDEVTRLTRELREAHRSNNEDDLVRQVIGKVADAPRDPPPWLRQATRREKGKPDLEVPMTCWADWHLGEVVEAQEVHNYNAYNMSIAEARVHRLFEKTIYLASEHHTGNYPGIVVNLVGDMVSGGLHPELLKTDELEVIPAALKAIDWMITGLTMMKGRFGKVYVPAVCGNHGRNTAKPEFKRYAKKNFDYLISRIVERHFADDPDVRVNIRDSNDVHYRVYALRFLLNHGDMLGVKGGDGIIGAIGPIMRGEIKKSGQSAALGLEYDINIMGHWHQELMLPRAIVCNTLKGFDEYARLQLGAKPTRPTQPLWFVHPVHGITARWSVYVDEPGKPATAWVSVFDREAA